MPVGSTSLIVIGAVVGPCAIVTTIEYVWPVAPTTNGFADAFFVVVTIGLLALVSTQSIASPALGVTVQAFGEPPGVKAIPLRVHEMDCT